MASGDSRHSRIGLKEEWPGCGANPQQQEARQQLQGVVSHAVPPLHSSEVVDDQITFHDHRKYVAVLLVLKCGLLKSSGPLPPDLGERKPCTLQQN